MTTNNSINRRTDLLNVSPSGTGAGETGEVRFQELAANGTNYVALKAADSTATQTYTLPDAYPASNGQVLSAQTDGTMSWAAAATGGVSGPVSTTQDALVRWDGTDGSTVADSTITLDGSGNMSGVTSIAGSASVTVEADSLSVTNGNDSTAGAELRLYEASDNGSNYIAVKAPDDLAANNEYTLPDSYPSSNGQVLASTTTGEMSWVTAGGGGGGGSLESLSDVNITNPQPGHTLRYDSGEWVNQPLPSVAAPRRLRIFQGGTNNFYDPLSPALEYDNWIDVLKQYALNADGNIYHVYSKDRTYDGGDAVAFPLEMTNTSDISNYFARKSDGTTIAWGNNGSGELGLGTTGGIITPTQIGSDTDWDRFYSVRATTNFAATLAMKDDNTLWAAGTNASGITGQGVTTGNITTFAQIGSDDDWKVAAVVYHLTSSTSYQFTAAALKNDGSLWAWGSNNFGLTGQGVTTGNTLTPTQIGSDTDWVRIWGMQSVGSTGSNPNFTQPSCFIALKSDGTLWSWGGNMNGFTAQGTTSGNTTVPTQIGSDTDWVDIVRYSSSAGSPTRITALKSNGDLYCWGGGSNSGTAMSTPTRLGAAVGMAIYPGLDSTYVICKDMYGVFNKVELNNNTPANATISLLGIDVRNAVVIGSRGGPVYVADTFGIITE